MATTGVVELWKRLNQLLMGSGASASRFHQTGKRPGIGHQPLGKLLRVEILEDRWVPANIPVLIHDLNPGPASSDPREFVQLHDSVLLSGYSQQGGMDGLWRTAGPDGGTAFVSNLPFSAFDFKSVGEQVYFWSPLRKGLWRTDGTAAGTFLAKDFPLSPNYFNGTSEYAFAPSVVAGSTLYFPGETRVVTGSIEYSWVLVQGIEPWWVDGFGAASSTHSFNLDNSPITGSSPQQYTDFNGSVFFTAAGLSLSSNRQLWKAPNSNAAAEMILNPSAGGATVSFGEIARTSNRLFMATNDNKLWSSDGTAAGTQTVTTLAKPVQHLSGVGSRLFMTAAGTTSGSIELWSSDSTVAGTVSFTTLSGTNAANFSGFFTVGNRAFFIWDDGTSGSELWVTDGTAAGTHLVKDIRSGTQGSAIVVGSANRSDPIAVGNSLYFVADDGVHGSELWVSDGTLAGTELVIDSKPGIESGSPSWLTSIAGALYLNMYDAAIGNEPFVIGTPTFVRPKSDLVARVQETGDWYVGSSDGSQLATAYWSTWAPEATWVHVQTGDFNGDGLADIVGRVAESGQWYVGLSNGAGFETQLWETWSAIATWQDVHVADFTGDGLDDIVGYAGSGEWYVGVSTGLGFSSSLWGNWDATAEWVDVRVGDFNGDGVSDIAGRNQASGQWYVGRAVSPIGVGAFPIAAFATTAWGTWSPGINWVDVRVGDFNGDGRDDLIGRWQATGQWWSAIANGTSFTNAYWGSWSTGITWVDLLVGDFNGDHRADLVGRWMETGQWWVGESTGTTMQNRYFGQWTASLTWADVQVGDFDGDGRSDLIGRWKETGQWYVARSTGLAFTNQLWATWSNQVTWTDVLLGDYS